MTVFSARLWPGFFWQQLLWPPERIRPTAMTIETLSREPVDHVFRIRIPWVNSIDTLPKGKNDGLSTQSSHFPRDVETSTVGRQLVDAIGRVIARKTAFGKPEIVSRPRERHEVAKAINAKLQSHNCQESQFSAVLNGVQYHCNATRELPPECPQMRRRVRILEKRQ
jgi:hypothetical protein